MEIRTVIALIALIFLGTAQASESFKKGLASLEAEAYEEAVENFQAHLKEYPLDDQGYYNLGIAYYRTKDYPKGLWAFEKSLKINPSHEEAAANAAYAHQKLNLKGEWKPESGVFVRLFYGVGKNLWAWVTVLTGVLLGIILALFIAYRKREFAVMLQFSLALLSLFFIAFFLLARGHRNYLREESQGIIVAATATGKAGPDEKLKTLFTLPAGQRVRITDKQDGWTEVQLNPETVGWIPDEDLWGY
jgi:tetratricopeptide (TPR) repeat protein